MLPERLKEKIRGRNVVLVLVVVGGGYEKRVRIRVRGDDTDDWV